MVEVGYQIIHRYLRPVTDEIVEALQAVFADYYKEVDLSTISAAVSINYEYHSNKSNFFCGFNISLDLDIYELFDHSAFFQKFSELLLNNELVYSLIKLNDSSRLEEYVLYYQQIAQVEMKLREVITFILSDCLNGNYYNLLANQQAKLLINGVKKEEKEAYLKSKSENELYYLVFKQYASIEVPFVVDAGLIGQLIDMLSADQLKEKLQYLKVFNTENYSDFLSRIKEDLASIEAFRNCIAHNRAYTDDEWSSYDKAINQLSTAIAGFWESLFTEEEEEGSYFEDEACNSLKYLMNKALWHTKKQEVHIPINIDEEKISYDKLKSYDDLIDYLSERAYDEGSNYFPSDPEFRELAENDFNSNRVVKKVLKNYSKEIKKMKW